MWLMFAVGISIGICIGVACTTTAVIVEDYLEYMKHGKFKREGQKG